MTTATAITTLVPQRAANKPVSKPQKKATYFRRVLVTVWSLAAVDAVSVSASVACSLLICTGLGVAVASYTAAGVFAIATVCAMYCFGVYKPGIHPVYETRQSMVALAFASLVAVSHLLAAGQPWIPVLLFLPFGLLTPVVRAMARSAFSKTTWWGVPCFVYGADRRINTLYAQHQKNAGRGLIPSGFLQEKLPENADEIADHFVSTPRRTQPLASRVSCALVHRRGRTDNEIQDFIDTHLRGFARVIILPDDPRVPSLWSMGGTTGISIEDNLLRPTSQFVKRTVDIFVAGVGLTLGAPVFAVLALWIKLTSSGPVLYGHTRISRDGKRFKVWKFRSMVTNAEEVLKKHLSESYVLRDEWEATHKLQKDPRVTTVGRFLRKTSLDELPQLWNVLVGEMSLVGPRPIVEHEIERYQCTFKSYIRVRPGITGFWQVSGRNLTTYERRVELDEFYVRNWSVWFDLYILVRTVKTVLLREGAF